VERQISLAEKLRQEATRLRKEAGTEQDPKVRAEHLSMAEYYEELAAAVERTNGTAMCFIEPVQWRARGE
jgi:hypothetical protein